MGLTQMAYISRINNWNYKTKKPAKGRSKGWRIRFIISENGKYKNVGDKRFNDNKYAGGKDESLVYAKVWRDSKYAELLIFGIIEPYRSACRKSKNVPPASTHLTVNNTSGVSGVTKFKRRYVKKIGCGKTRNIYSFEWRAIWIEYYIHKEKPQRKFENKSFSVRKYGDKEAFDMACEARAKKVKYLLSSHHMKIRQEYQKQNK
jgi:hypothetical protein